MWLNARATTTPITVFDQRPDAELFLREFTHGIWTRRPHRRIFREGSR